MNNTGWSCETPRKCQLEAYSKITENDQGIVNMTCGAGKTDVQIKTMFDYNVILHISPRKILVSEHSNKYELMLKNADYNIIQVNSDLNNSHKYVAGVKTVFFINIQSLYIFEQLGVKPELVIVDEAHYMTQSIVDNDLVNSVKNVYLFTATPNSLLLKTWPEIFKYMYSQAVLDKCVCDFTITLIKEKQENPKKVIAELKQKMKENNLYKCIVYLNGSHANTKHDLVVDNFNGIKGILTLTGKDNDKVAILKKFNQDPKITILVSCKTVSMGYNMNNCDCVLIDRPGNSISDNVQRMMRCLRIGKPDKKPIVFLRMPDLDLDDEDDSGYYESESEENDSEDITESVQKSKFSKIMLIINCLKQGLGLETLEEYLCRKSEETEQIKDEDRKSVV